MLILARKKDESIMVGDIEVKITSIGGDHVKIGIDAPRSVPVYRKEIYDSIQAQNVAAVSVDIDDIDILSDFIQE